MEVAHTPATTAQPPAAERKYTTISIPQPLYLEVKRAIEGTGFRSPTEYLVYVTRLSLQAHAGDARPRAPPPRPGY